MADGRIGYLLWWGAFTWVGWQVTLSDPIWQLMLCSSEIGLTSDGYLLWFIDN